MHEYHMTLYVIATADSQFESDGMIFESVGMKNGILGIMTDYENELNRFNESYQFIVRVIYILF